MGLFKKIFGDSLLSNRNNMMKRLIDWYIKHYREEIVRADSELRSSFNLALLHEK